ncbi:MAG: alcohol dehydrogenase catalytic domain-containing protein [Streptosporangiales bacterium]|nr:alcohol dehydrogenase catalytic domain-containing protein [Streptosporangiales bacterium]
MMLALELYRSLPRYVASKVVTRRLSAVSAGPLTPLRLVTKDEPRVPKSDGWARVRPRLSGICGSDLGALYGSTSLYFSALVSMPFVPGHEIVGDLQDSCGDLPAGTRVVIDPVLTCAARGVEACDSCAQGNTNRCDRVTVGHVSPGLQTGYCADTGGGWGAQLVAHRSQLHPVPDTIEDRRAVLVEPLSCAVHTALRANVPDGGSVLVVGSGAVGLLTTLALRELTNVGTLTVVAKHPLQRALAKRFGATDVLAPSDVIGGVRRATRALRLDPEHDAPYLLGGVDVAIDAAGSAESLRTALRTVRAGGRVVLSAMPPAGADLSPVWFRELEVVGTYASARSEPVDCGRAGAFDLAMRLAAAAPLDGLVGDTYPLHRWREALDHASSAGRLGTVKVAFDLRSRS